MDIHFNSRISRKPIAIEYEDLSPQEPYTGPRYTRVLLEQALQRTYDFLKGNARYDSSMHSMQRIIWEDGTWSWASPSCRAKTLYINSAAGSPMVIAHF